MNLTLQIHWDSEWHDAGIVRFHREEQGLAGTPSFVYSTEYAYRVLEGHQDLENQEVIGKTAVGVNLPCSFSGDYYEGEVAPVLRDIIPQGASRRLWLKRLGYDRDREKAIDVRLLAEGCIAPIGNLRIKEAAEAFQQKLVGMTPSLFSAEEIGISADRLFEYTQQVGIASGGALGAGGDAPKLLLVENHQGQFALEGTIPESQIQQHWLVKFPRGRKTQRDRDVLKGEAAIYNAVEGTAVESIPNASLQQVDGQLALWLPRFDREIKGGAVLRHGVESIYSMMGRIGDGAALDHVEIIQRLLATTTEADIQDRLLADYLVRDVLNATVGNRDNHGRNTALIKRDEAIELAPAYDVAPMVLDPESIARVSRWPNECCHTPNEPNYPTIIQWLSNDPIRVAEIVTESLETLTGIRERLIKCEAPKTMIDHPGVRLDYPGQILHHAKTAIRRI